MDRLIKAGAHLERLSYLLFEEKNKKKILQAIEEIKEMASEIKGPFQEEIQALKKDIERFLEERGKGPFQEEIKAKILKAKQMTEEL